MIYRTLLTGIIFLVVSNVTKAQPSPAELLAEKIAQKMKDSLSLSQTQRQAVYNINIDLHTQKQSVRQRFQAADSLRYYMQHIESTRDSLYRRELSDEQYNLYKTKKRNLVSNN